MPSRRRLILLIAVAVAASAFVTTPPAFAASSEKVLYSFQDNGTDGYEPVAGLIFDKAGNLYGTTSVGGAHGGGAVFQLTPGAGGTWSEAVLYSFCAAAGCADGKEPLASLILDLGGNLYGTTSLGGAYGAGAVFQLAPEAGGTWTEAVLHSFGSGKDGSGPLASLIFDADGNLYGTTFEGGAHSQGTVFELTSAKGGAWTENMLHNFAENGKDGYNPHASLIFDGAGNLYGTTGLGGSGACPPGNSIGCGTAFELTPKAGGSWTEKVLHHFNNNGKDGHHPYASLILDTDGNLYGTTTLGGAQGQGTVFELTPKEGGSWAEKVLHTFRLSRTDGNSPEAGVILDASGNLYGTTFYGGSKSAGTVFELTSRAGGSWAENILHNFSYNGEGGNLPAASLIFDASGNLYGTTTGGGSKGCNGRGCGTVFEITP
jgi:uncharacterized repeat protein (TIGR03803 family)